MSFTWDRTVAEYDRLFRDVADIRPCREDIRRGKPAAAALQSLPGKLKSETDATHGTSAIRSRR